MAPLVLPPHIQTARRCFDLPLVWLHGGPSPRNLCSSHVRTEDAGSTFADFAVLSCHKQLGLCSLVTAEQLQCTPSCRSWGCMAARHHQNSAIPMPAHEAVETALLILPRSACTNGHACADSEQTNSWNTLGSAPCVAAWRLVTVERTSMWHVGTHL